MCARHLELGHTLCVLPIDDYYGNAMAAILHQLTGPGRRTSKTLQGLAHLGYIPFILPLWRNVGAIYLAYRCFFVASALSVYN